MSNPKYLDEKAKTFRIMKNPAAVIHCQFLDKTESASQILLAVKLNIQGNTDVAARVGLVKIRAAQI